MMLYIISFAHKKELMQAVEENKQTILEGLCEERFALLDYIKKQANQYQMIKKFLVDLDSLKDTEEEIIEAFSSFRLLFDDAQIIVIASGRKDGDPLLSRIFDMGIYDILTGDEEEELGAEMADALMRRRTYRESLRFRVTEPSSPMGGNGPVVERIKIKKEIVTQFLGLTVGFAGSQERTGTTHQVISAAVCLQEKGFRVAVIENNKQKNAVFSYIRDGYEDSSVRSGEEFTLAGIDFFHVPDIPSQMQGAMKKGYNFILVDFGCFRDEIITDLENCIRMVFVCGSKGWEVPKVDKIFDGLSPELLQQSDFLFNLADPEQESLIRDNMGSLRTFFPEFQPDMFKGGRVFGELFGEYLPQNTIEEQSRAKKNILDQMKGVINKNVFFFKTKERAR